MTGILRHNRQSLLVTLLLLFCLTAYMLPWVSTSSASLSLNAYDMAEWATLTPAVRAENPPLFTSFLLRLPLVCIAVLFALNLAQLTYRFMALWLGVVFFLFFALFQLPPFAFLTTGRHDPNYQQQFVMVVLTLILGMVGLFSWRRRWSGLLMWLAAGIGSLASLSGLLRGYNVMQSYDLPASIGMGGPLLIVFLLVSLGLMLGENGKNNRAVN